MSINEIVVLVLVIFMIIGAADKIGGNRFGYGEQFERGFMAMGPLAIAMIGIISLAPVLAELLRPVVVPFFSWMGADPAMFATAFLALDMGGYPLALELAESRDAALFAGILLGTMLGPTLTFTIPVALGLIEKEDRPYLAKGVLAGLTTIPLGLLAGGAAAGFSMEMMLRSIVPIVIFSGGIALGLWLQPRVMVTLFMMFGQGVTALMVGATAVIIFQTLTGWTLVSGMAPISEGIQIVGMIAIMLAGAFPLVHFLKKAFGKALSPLGNKVHMNEISVVGWLSSLAHAIPMFGMARDMNPRGKVMNFAFAVSGAFILGGHLAFTASVEEEMITAMMIGKITGGITAMIAAFVLTRDLEAEVQK
ncbi:ethanolamine utilization protein EutH [Bacillus sp. FJAT-44742]|uniref:ethanolamine utilization protein EutH n=1 Tax=Bacillus sp. FJAT-44742 TaxID=2014005 RepID=UPI000C232E16|nr:ethanolamine utilization protein EutH [Bacillus sp. FJAT-44742]